MASVKRKRVKIEPRDETQILKALEAWAKDGELIALRTRAFVYLLWDGAVRTTAALSLNAEEVVADPDAARIRVVKQAIQRPCEGNRYKEREIFMSPRTREALTEYLRAVRKGGWLPAERLQGPLFISNYYHGTGKRLPRRTAIQVWQTFQQDHTELSQEYQLDDVVYTGRLAFMKASSGSSDMLSEHAGLTYEQAATYRERGSGESPESAVERMHKKR